MLLYGRNYQLSLGSIHRSTGYTTDHPLPLNGNSRLYAFEAGFFLPFHDPLSFYFLPRERVDPTYVQPAPIPAPLVALPAYLAPIEQPPNAVESAPAPSSLSNFHQPRWTYHPGRDPRFYE